MGQDHAKADGAAVILHVKGIARKAERVGEVIDDLGDVVEGVCEVFWVGPVTVGKAGVIGGDEVIAVGEAREERFKHARGRGKSVQQDERGGVFGTGLPVKDGEAIYLYSAINSRVFHGAFPPLAVGRQCKGYKHRPATRLVLTTCNLRIRSPK